MGLTGITELSLGGRGPKRAFVFDEHRLALPCWAKAGARGALLVSFDRHFDTVPPRAPPHADLERYARDELDPRNFDHIPAAVQAGVLSGAVLVARARPPGAVTEPYVTAPTLDALLQRDDVMPLLEASNATVLDFDLDCFTSPSDADPTTIVPWTKELIRDHVMPRGSERFWEAALSKCLALTFAREPKHCGGLVAGGRLFELAAGVVFEELLQTDLP